MPTRVSDSILGTFVPKHDLCSSNRRVRVSDTSGTSPWKRYSSFSYIESTHCARRAVAPMRSSRNNKSDKNCTPAILQPDVQTAAPTRKMVAASVSRRSPSPFYNFQHCDVGQRSILVTVCFVTLVRTKSRLPHPQGMHLLLQRCSGRVRPPSAHSAHDTMLSDANASRSQDLAPSRVRRGQAASNSSTIQHPYSNHSGVCVCVCVAAPHIHHAIVARLCSHIAFAFGATAFAASNHARNFLRSVVLTVTPLSGSSPDSSAHSTSTLTVRSSVLCETTDTLERK